MNSTELEKEINKLKKLKKEKEDHIEEIRKFANNSSKVGLYCFYLNTFQLEVLKAGDSDDNLDLLIEKWRGVCQQALQELQAKANVPSTTIGDIIQHLQIDEKLVQYVPDIDGFL